MELVFVVKRRELEAELALPDGYAALDPERAARLRALLETRGFFVERRHAEHDPELKQPIPYCVVHDDRALLCVRRLKKSSEARLRGAWSVGIGGHIEPVDREPTRQVASEAQNGASSAVLAGIVDRAARRELHEELLLSSPSEARLVGWLNDDSNAVGQVHLGLVHLLHVGDSEVAIRETERLQGGFLPLEALLALREEEALPNALLTAHRTTTCDPPIAPTVTEGLTVTERSSAIRSNSSPASENEPVPRDWTSFETWSRFVLEALRPQDLAVSKARWT